MNHPMRELNELIELLSGAAECLNRVSEKNIQNESNYFSANDNHSLILFEYLSCPNCGHDIYDSKINSENCCKQCGISFLICQCNWCTALLISPKQNTIVCSNCHHSLDIRVCGYCKSANYYIGQSQICSSCGLDIHHMNPGQESFYYILVLQILILKRLESEYNYKRSVFFKEYSRLFSDEKYVKNRIERNWHEFPSCDETSPYIDRLAVHLNRDDVIIALHQILKIVASESRISTQAMKLIRNVFDKLGLNQSEISYFISEYFFVYGVDNYKELNIPSELMRYFIIMDIKTDSTVDDVKKRYRELAMKFHPDRNIGKSEDAIRAQSIRFMSVQEAYDVLIKYFS
jgi:hypothetical protein